MRIVYNYLGTVVAVSGAELCAEMQPVPSVSRQEAERRWASLDSLGSRCTLSG